jgi:predicted HicB family RNase H-like nuclease
MSKFQYKGYKARIEYSHEDEIFVGRVSDVGALIVFSAESVSELVSEFQSSIDEYLKTCAEDNIKPDKPCSGTFNVRVGVELHRRAIARASMSGISLNEFVRRSLQKALDDASSGRSVNVSDAVGAVVLTTQKSGFTAYGSVGTAKRPSNIDVMGELYGMYKYPEERYGQG